LLLPDAPFPPGGRVCDGLGADEVELERPASPTRRNIEMAGKEDHARDISQADSSNMDSAGGASEPGERQ